MIFFDNDYENKLIEAVKEDFERLYEKMDNEKIYAGCLTIDDEATGMFITFNTVEYLNKKDISLFNEDPFKDFREILSPEDFQASFGPYDGMVMSTRWIPDEWGYGNNSLEDSFINKKNAMLLGKHGSLKTDAESYIFEAEIHEVMINTLVSLKKHIEKKLGYGIFLFMSINGSEQSKLIENESAKKLNPEKSYHEFINRTKLSKKKLNHGNCAERP